MVPPRGQATGRPYTPVAGHLCRLSGRLLTGGSVTKRRKCPAPSVQPPAAARHSAQTTSASAPPAPAAVRSSRIHRLGPQRPFCRVCLRAIGRQRPEGRQRSYRGGHSLMSILGTRVLRTEDPRFLTTGGVYTEDLTDDRLDGACHVFFVRSPVAHARVDRIDLSAALAAPGVVAAFTGADLAGLPSIEPMMAGLLNAKMTRRPLATDKVRFVGDPVAVVVTEDPYQGEDAVGHTFDNQRVAPAPMESRAGAAVWGDDGRLTSWIPNQGAQSTREGLAEMLGVEASQVRVITPDVGGAFGAKFGADPEHAVVAWVARQLGRPARWTETRFENMIAMTHGRAQRHAVTIGGSRDGDVRAYRLEIVQDGGAYPRIGAVLPFLTIMMATGPYSIPDAEAVGTSVVTTTTPVGAYRGAGRPEATAAIERAFDLFAAEIGKDPAEVRRRNLLPPFTEPHQTAFGALYDSGDYAAALDKALEAAGYRELRAEQARRRASGDVVQLGIGIACYVEITGGGDEAGPPQENASVQVHQDGTATILTGTSPHGQGHSTAWAMIASEELGIPVENFTVKWGDTDLIPVGGGTGGSRSLQQGGAAVQQASRELVEVARERAAAALEASADDLAKEERLFVHSIFTAPGATFPFGTHVAVADVDTQTGKAVLRRVITADDAGLVLNPLLAEGQRHGGIAQGAAQALLEEVVYDADGNPLTASFADYPIVSATELPSFELATSETPTSYNRLGAKGIRG